MSEIKEDLNGYFCPSSDNGLPPEILGELESMLRLHSISPQELFYKWESYSLKMGSEETKLDLNTVRMFKKDVQDGLEREHRGKNTGRTDRRSAVAATPRGAVTGDVFGMYGCPDSTFDSTADDISQARRNYTEQAATQDSSQRQQWETKRKL